jgi:hypothetical protein
MRLVLRLSLCVCLAGGPLLQAAEAAACMEAAGLAGCPGDEPGSEPCSEHCGGCAFCPPACDGPQQPLDLRSADAPQGSVSAGADLAPPGSEVRGVFRPPRSV